MNPGAGNSQSSLKHFYVAADFSVASKDLGIYVNEIKSILYLRKVIIKIVDCKMSQLILFSPLPSFL